MLLFFDKVFVLEVPDCEILFSSEYPLAFISIEVDPV